MSRSKMFYEEQEAYYTKDVYYTKVESNMFDLVLQGDYEAICSRIKTGTSANLRNNQDQTLLHYAVLYNQVKIAKLLISFGADLGAKDKFGQTVIDVIKEHNPELYNQINEHTKDTLRQHVEEGVMEPVVGSVEDSSCCTIC